MKTRPALLLLAILAVALAACSGGGSPAPGTPEPTSTPAPTSTPEPTSTPGSTPTPIAVEVETRQDAAAIVIASDPRFEGAIELSPDVIGASKWWEAAETESGYRITIVVGWGDCPAGCINQHTWVFDVGPDGRLTLVEESGDPVPADGIPQG